MSILRQQLRSPPLGFPGRLPGFDPSHPAASNIRLQLIPIGSNFCNFALVKVGVPTNSPTSVINGNIGPSVTFASASSQRVAFTSVSGFNESSITLAAILVLNALSTNGGIISTGSTHGYVMRVNSTGKLVLEGISPGGGFQSTFVLSTGIPYFLATTFDGANVKYVATNLATGQIFTSAGTITKDNAASNTGSFVGEDLANIVYINASIGAVMYSGTFLSSAQLSAWAADPWEFWYPRTIYGSLDNIGSVIAAGGFTAKFRRSLSAVGGRVGTRQAV